MKSEMAKRLGLTLSLLLAAMLLSACSHHHHRHTRASGNPGAVIVKDGHHRHGPPPHAPAHGYRHKHGDGSRLRFDSRLGVYVVLGHDDTWFVDDLYVRWSGGRWMASMHLDGGWTEYSADKLPKTLRGKKFKHQGKRKKRH